MLKVDPTVSFIHWRYI